MEVYEASLCPGCGRPIDVCADDYATERPWAVDTHVCMPSLARAVQQRIDEWENTDPSKRPDEAPLKAEHHDGRMYAPRPATPEEMTTE